MFEKLRDQGFQIEFRSHAAAIIQSDFPAVASQLATILLSSTIPIEEIVASGGGETKGTQRLRKALKEKSWIKHKFVVQRIIDGKEREAQSHEVDHVQDFSAGTVALEIEWNNKDPFFDRDLENFKRLHADGAISLGIIVTRGTSLQENMRQLITRFADENDLNSEADLRRLNITPTPKQLTAIRKRTERKSNPLPFRQAWVDNFVSNKFGAATTHWGKLNDRIQRGVGNPCPLLLIGLPDTIVKFDENPTTVRELLDEGADAEEAE